VKARSQYDKVTGKHATKATKPKMCTIVWYF
jgi:hypothetical protein